MSQDAPDAPPFPQNVVLVFTDGTRQPVDCRYLGTEDGMAVWQVLCERTDVARVQVDVLPPKCSVRLRVLPT